MSLDYEMGSFEVVCPHCSAIFDLNAAVVRKGFDYESGEEFLKVTCPDCDEVRIIELNEE